MNRVLSKIGAAVVTVTVFLFAVCILTHFLFGSYLVCMFLPIGFIIMTAGFQHESAADTKVAANIGLTRAEPDVPVSLIYSIRHSENQLADCCRIPVDAGCLRMIQ